jgi:hypothetical protein
MRFVAALARPPRILSIVALVWLLAIVVIHSDTGVSIIGFFLLMYGGFGLAAAWGIRGAFLARARRASPSPPAGRRIWWTVVPACLVAGIACSLLPAAPHNPLFRVRFNLSESALTSHAGRLSATSVDDFRGRRVGMFRVVRTEAHDHQVRLITTNCGVVDSCGLVYSPRGSPQRWQEDQFVHIRGPWWHVFEGF